MSPSRHPPLQLTKRSTLDPKTRMWNRSGDGYAADSLRYRVAKVHRDAEWSPLEKHLSQRKRGSCSLLECVSNGRRRRVGEDGKSPLDLRPHPLLFDLHLGHPRLQLMRERREVLPPASDMLAA